MIRWISQGLRFGRAGLVWWCCCWFVGVFVVDFCFGLLLAFLFHFGDLPTAGGLGCVM